MSVSIYRLSVFHGTMSVTFYRFIKFHCAVSVTIHRLNGFHGTVSVTIYRINSTVACLLLFLGHPRGVEKQSQLRQVSNLNHPDICIVNVPCSDAATVCLTTRGDIYVLHEYQCRKIASK